jgi:Coenzyme PQQ synthesis protein D (PqqD)
MNPLARTADLIVEALASETIVYDTRRNRVHCLNETSTFIWRYCDGQTSVTQIAEKLSERLGEAANPDVVRFGLRRLKSCGLLEEAATEETMVSRRELTKRLALLGGTVAAALPMITSIVAPTPAMAGSRDHYGDDDSSNGKSKGHEKSHGNGKGHGSGHD